MTKKITNELYELIMEDLVDIVQDIDLRQEIHESMITHFQSMNINNLDELIGHDDAFDMAYKNINGLDDEIEDDDEIKSFKQKHSIIEDDEYD